MLYKHSDYCSVCILSMGQFRLHLLHTWLNKLLIVWIIVISSDLSSSIFNIHRVTSDIYTTCSSRTCNSGSVPCVWLYIGLCYKKLINKKR